MSSRRFGSSINSKLFMEDPVPAANGEKAPVSSYFPKGDKTESSDYQLVGGKDEIFLVNGKNGKYQLSRKNLKDTLVELKKHSKTSLKHLGKKHLESFNGLVESLGILYGSQALYDLVLADIREVFGDVKEVKPGTVAAFFLGCFDEEKFPGPMGCNPKCAASLHDSSESGVSCEDLVLIYSEGVFSSLNSKNPKHTYIYVEDADFDGFTRENISQLKEAGVSKATLVFGTQNGSYREIASATKVSKLPSKENNNNVVVQTQESDTLDEGTGGVIFICIVVVILIVLLAALYRTGGYW